MTVVFVYTVDDYLNDPIVLKLKPVVARKASVFPAVSVCIEKHSSGRVSNYAVDHFVRNYYAEHSIPEPEQ